MFVIEFQLFAETLAGFIKKQTKMSNETDVLIESNDNPKTGLFCDACDKPMLRKEQCWVFENDAPIGYSAYGFCLCLNCHPGSLTTAKHSLVKEPGFYCLCAASACSCRAHGSPSRDSDDSANDSENDNDSEDDSANDSEEECCCRCSVCDKSGHVGCETAWYIGRAFVSQDKHGYGDVEFTFLVCPECVPSTVQDGLQVDGEFSKKWFDPHLTKTVLQDKFFLRQIEEK